jgi:outer membrane lipoprotein-sorting protein
MTHQAATATIAALLTLVIAATPTQAQTVDDIVARHLASRGGAETWRAIESQRTTGTVYTQGIELAMVLISKRPNLSRQELAIEIPGQGTVPILNLFDGTKAWTVNPMLGGSEATELSGRDAETIRDQSEMDSPLFDYKSKGHDVQLLGVEAVGTRQAHRLKVTRPGRAAAHYFIDVETGVELRIAGDAAGSAVVDLSDHRPVGGALVPHRIRVAQAGQPEVEVVVTSVEFNVPTTDAMFRRP